MVSCLVDPVTNRKRVSRGYRFLWISIDTANRYSVIQVRSNLRTQDKYVFFFVFNQVCTKNSGKKSRIFATS